MNYTVRDAAGATDTGTLTITVNLVNDAPSGTDRTVRINGDAAYVFSAADFGFSDAEGNAFAGVKIADLPGQGTLYYDADGGDAANAVAVVQGQSVDVAAIEAGKLFYQPAAGASGLTYANFSFQVQDDGGTAGGGNDTDSSANTITIDVNAAPHLAFIADPDADSLVENYASARTNRGLINLFDDGLGANNLTLSGPDAHRFELVSQSSTGFRIYFKAGTVPDYETQSSYTVTVSIDDPSIGDGPEELRSLSLSGWQIRTKPPSRCRRRSRSARTRFTY